MKTKAALKAQQEYTKEFVRVLVEQLEGEVGDKIAVLVTNKLHGESSGYGDSGWHRSKAVATDAKKQVIEGLKKTGAKAPKAKLSDEKYEQVKEACRKTTEIVGRGEGRAYYARKGGRFLYEILIGDERVAEFASTGLAAAKKFAKNLGIGKHEVKRLTRREQRNRAVAYATSPTSEAYWSS